MLQELLNSWVSFWQQAQAKAFGLSHAKEIREVQALLAQRLKEGASGGADPHLLTGEERAIWRTIRRATEEQNRNNVTRTQAYWDFYKRCPEVHWALLAHMVSRNGGYNMTDLRGELLAKAMEGGEAERFFHFLERANDLIFGDAYPQLLLYEESKRRGEPLFHLLPYFGVTCFMSVLWKRFWVTRDSATLTMGLVVNEQNYIERRVVQHEQFRPVVESFEFVMQTLLNLTQVVFPYQPATGGRVRLAGVTVDTFTSLPERIDTGRELYAILFRAPGVLEAVTRWAERTPHTGSRADYWPHLFTSEATRFFLLKGRVQGCELAPGARPFYSPRLVDAWPDVKAPHPAEPGDWCTSTTAAEELYLRKPTKHWDLTERYCETFALIEKAVEAEAWVKGK